MAGMFDELVNQAKGAASSANNYVQDTVIPGIKGIGNYLFSSPTLTGTPELYVIGRPYAFNQYVDPYKRLSSYIRTKMSVIDLIPCYYEMAFNKMQENIKEGEAFKGGLYKVDYADKIKQFQDLCWQHGLGTGPNGECYWSGVRLYTTDDTTATDSFNVQYQENFFQDMANKLSNMSQSIKQLTQLREAGGSVTGRGQETTDKGGQQIKQVVIDLLKKAGASETTSSNIGSLMDSVKDLLKGNRVTFPKIWQNTTHTNNLSAVIKLVSPYGSPKAVKEFIIKPLMVLTILSSAQTSDGISYGNVIPLTIKAYGMNYTILGAINSITLRRGGADSSFNVYRQPLTIDVSIDFQTLFDAFAVYTHNKDDSKPNPDWRIFTNSNYFEPSSGEIDTTIKTPLSTMGSMLESLKPVQLVEGDFQVYGNFLRPTRTDIPGTGIGTNVNLATGIATPVVPTSSIDSLSATLATAKNSVSNIGGRVESWATTAKTSASNIVRDKIKLNLKEWGRL